MRPRPWLLPTALALLLAGALALTNPGPSAFAAHYADRLNREVLSQAGLTGTLGELLGGVTQSALEGVLREEARRTDLLLLSIYRLPLAGEDLQAVGVLGRFITLQGPGGP